MDDIRHFINAHYDGVEPARIVLEVAGTIVVLLLFQYVLRNLSDLKDKTVSIVFHSLKAIPAVQDQVNKEKLKLRKMVESKLAVNQEPVLSISIKGVAHEEILNKMEQLRAIDEKKWQTGKVSGCIYGGELKHTELLNKVYALFSLSNPLHADLFPSVRKFEAEIIRMTANMMNGDSNSCGAVTSGGTESILMAVKAYRDRAKLKHPEIIVPVTAHAAFDKAASYFCIKIIHVPVDKKGQVNPKDVEVAITKNTIMIAGSAPEYCHGIVDPIPQLAAIAHKHGIGFHTDCCLGGFILPWVQKSGIDGGRLPLFDFRVPGVTSMSVDTHKYGYSTKGTSVILFRNEELRRHMFFVEANWPGGLYASPTILGSRSGGVIACCWASLVAIGQEGFLARSQAIWKTAQKIKEGIKKIRNLELIGDSPSQVVAFGSSSLDVYKVGDAMSAKGWNLNMLQKPAGVHICCTTPHIGIEETFLKDLADSVAIVAGNPNAFPDGLAPMYGMAASFPDRTTIAEIGTTYLEAVLQTQSL